MVKPTNKYTDKTNHISLFYIHDANIKEGSAQATHIVELINNFPDNIKAHCIGPDPNHPVDNYIKLPKVVAKPDRSIALKILWQALNEIMELGYLLLLIRRYRPDIFIVRSGIQIFPFISSKIFGIPIVLEINGLGVAERSISSGNKIFYRIVFLIEKKMFNSAKKLIVVSPGIKNALAEINNLNLDKFITISNGVNIELFTILNSEASKKKINLDINYKYVCFIGSFAPWHGLEHLVKAAPLILENIPNTKFILVGDGITKDSIKKLIDELKLNNDFIFFDTVPNKEIPIYINASDVCVILKRKDIPGSPLKLREYMACGKPVVATKSPDFNILCENFAGILVDPENSIELSNAIMDLLRNKDLCESMGKNGRNCVIECFSWSKVASRVANVCSEALKDNM